MTDRVSHLIVIVDTHEKFATWSTSTLTINGRSSDFWESITQATVELVSRVSYRTYLTVLLLIGCDSGLRALCRLEICYTCINPQAVTI